MLAFRCGVDVLVMELEIKMVGLVKVGVWRLGMNVVYAT